MLLSTFTDTSCVPSPNPDKSTYALISSASILSMFDLTPFTNTSVLLLETILALYPSAKYFCSIVPASIVFCSSSPNVAVIVTFFILIYLTPDGLLIVTL